ncbi:MAG: GAF domain-containing protein [Chloroflexi bacterium]|nr:GAF domain-containing protein [Chloroflexota bacterium]MCL5108382.1 GAF domain-containing protein [Chloroflexota bacterium]
MSLRLLALADRVSIQVKIMGIVVGLVVLLGLGATYQLHAHLAEVLGRELDERAVSVARDLAARSSDLILTNNTYGLYELARDTLENNRDVRYVIVLGSDGTPLVHTLGSAISDALVEANAVTAQGRSHLEVLATEEGLIRDVAVPIFEGYAGTARVGLSDRRMVTELEASTRQLLIMTGVVSLLGLAFAYLLTIILTRPVSELVNVVRAVERGDLGSRVRPRTRDEIGVLGQAFNAMAESLARSHRQGEEYNQRLLRRNRELAALNLMASAVSQSRSLHDVLDTALDRSLQLTALAAGWVWLLEPDGTSLRLGAQLGFSDAGLPSSETQGRDECDCRAVIASGQARFVESAAGRCALLSRLGYYGHLSVPLVAKGRTLGVMNLAAATEREFAREELDILAAIGSQIGIALENARLWEEVTRKEELRVQLLDKIISAQEEERKRIARELHDETSQALTSLLVTLRLMEESSDQGEVRPRAREAREIAARTLAAVHGLARELRPSALDHLGLGPALEHHAREYATRHRLEIDFQLTGMEGLRLPPQVETTIYRVVQEALTNVARHAKARRVAVLLERRNDRVVGIVEDDGCGFDPKRFEMDGNESGLGLFGMRERAALVGGTLTIESCAGVGTTVFVEVPLVEVTVS